MARRFPLPWTFEDHNGTCFIVRDANGQALAYPYYEQEPGRRTAANLLPSSRLDLVRRIPHLQSDGGYIPLRT
jgi:hypothetical protein